MSDAPSEAPFGSEKKSKKEKKEKKSKKHSKDEEEPSKDKGPLPLRPPAALNSLDPSKLSRQPSLESLISEAPSEVPFGFEKKSKKDKKEKKSKKHSKDEDGPSKEKELLPVRPPSSLGALDPKKLSRQPSLESEISEVPSASGHKSKKDKKEKKEKKEKKSKKHQSYEDDELLDG